MLNITLNNIIIYSTLLIGCLYFLSCKEFSRGKVVYEEKCGICHGKDGEGLAKLIPSLYDSPFLKNNMNLLPCLIKNGKESFDDNGLRVAVMPPVELNEAELSNIMNYINQYILNNQQTISPDSIMMWRSFCQ